MGRLSPRIVAAGFEARNAAQMLVVITTVVEVALQYRPDDLELGQADGSRHVVHMILVADLANIHGRPWLCPVYSEPANPASGRQIVGILADEHPAIYGCQVLDRLKGKHDVFGMVPDAPPVVFGAQGMGCILDHRDTVSRRNLANATEGGRYSRVMDNHNRPRFRSNLREIESGERLPLLRIHVRPRPASHRHADGHISWFRGHRRGDDLVARGNARQNQGGMQGRCSGRKGQRVGIADECAELRLELPDASPSPTWPLYRTSSSLRHQHFPRREVHLEERYFHVLSSPPPGRCAGASDGRCRARPEQSGFSPGPYMAPDVPCRTA